MNNKGKFIVFEGIDGSGKTTQIGKLCEYLESKGRKVFITSEPTISMTGGILRDALTGVSKRTSCEMAAMFVLDRIFHNVNTKWGINKMLDEGFDVLCDRYYYSSFAYQGLDSDIDWLLECNLNCPAILKPDLCLFLDLDPKICAERISSTRLTKDIFETEETIRKIRKRFSEVFEKISDTENIAVVNAEGTCEEVAEKVLKAVNKIF
mgnify:CR=1 FL=1